MTGASSGRARRCLHLLALVEQPLREFSSNGGLWVQPQLGGRRRVVRFEPDESRGELDAPTVLAAIETQSATGHTNSLTSASKTVVNSCAAHSAKCTVPSRRAASVRVVGSGSDRLAAVPSEVSACMSGSHGVRRMCGSILIR